MSLFRYSRDTYGQETLQGVSWDLLWVFLGAAVLIAVGHAVFMAISRKPNA
jgi:hypothetical protein